MDEIIKIFYLPLLNQPHKNKIKACTNTIIISLALKEYFIKEKFYLISRFCYGQCIIRNHVCSLQENMMKWTVYNESLNEQKDSEFGKLEELSSLHFLRSLYIVVIWTSVRFFKQECLIWERTKRIKGFNHQVELQISQLSVLDFKQTTILHHQIIQDNYF